MSKSFMKESERINTLMQGLITIGLALAYNSKSNLSFFVSLGVIFFGTAGAIITTCVMAEKEKIWNTLQTNQ